MGNFSLSSDNEKLSLLSKRQLNSREAFMSFMGEEVLN